MIFIGIAIGLGIAICVAIIMRHESREKALELIEAKQKHGLSRSLAHEMYEFIKEEYYD